MISVEPKLYKKAQRLSYFTIGYNILEGLASIFAGTIAGSIALVGFGLDSFVESLSGGIMIWRFSKHGKISEAEEEKVEKKALKLVAYSFFILALYVLYESLKKLFLREIPQPSLLGIIIAVASLIVMPILFYSKYRVGKRIGSKSLIADSKQTLACVFLSTSLLIGLVLNYLFEFWQADPIVGLIVAFYLAREGVETLRNEKHHCC